MNKALLIVLLAISANAFSQKIVSDKVDDFNKMRVVSTSSVNFKGFSHSTSGTLYIEKNDTTIHLSVFFSPSIITSTSNKNKGLFKLDNGEVLELQNRSGYNIISAGDVGYMIFDLNEQERETLRNHSVVKYRLSSDDTDVDMDLKGKNQEAFKNIVMLLESKLK